MNKDNNTQSFDFDFVIVPFFSAFVKYFLRLFFCYRCRVLPVLPDTDLPVIYGVLVFIGELHFEGRKVPLGDKPAVWADLSNFHGFRF